MLVIWVSDKFIIRIPEVENLVAVPKFRCDDVGSPAKRNSLGTHPRLHWELQENKEVPRLNGFLKKCTRQTPKLSNITEKMNPCLHLMNIYQAPTRGHVQVLWDHRWENNYKGIRKTSHQIIFRVSLEGWIDIWWADRQGKTFQIIHYKNTKK